MLREFGRYVQDCQPNNLFPSHQRCVSLAYRRGTWVRDWAACHVAVRAGARHVYAIEQGPYLDIWPVPLRPTTRSTGRSPGLPAIRRRCRYPNKPMSSCRKRSGSWHSKSSRWSTLRTPSPVWKAAGKSDAFQYFIARGAGFRWTAA